MRPRALLRGRGEGSTPFAALRPVRVLVCPAFMRAFAFAAVVFAAQFELRAIAGFNAAQAATYRFAVGMEFER